MSNIVRYFPRGFLIGLFIYMLPCFHGTYIYFSRSIFVSQYPRAIFASFHPIPLIWLFDQPLPLTMIRHNKRNAISIIFPILTTSSEIQNKTVFKLNSTANLWLTYSSPVRNFEKGARWLTLASHKLNCHIFNWIYVAFEMAKFHIQEIPNNIFPCIIILP